MVNGQQCRIGLSRQRIPASRILPQGQALLKLVPRTSTEALLNNSLIQADPSFNNFHDYTVKGDQYFGSNHHLSLTFVGSENPSGGGSILPSPLTTAGTTIYSWDNARATYDWVIRPNLLNELRLGYNREIFTHSPTGSDAPGWQNQLRIPGYSTASSLFPGILWGSYRTLGNQQFWYATSNTYVLNESVAWTKGRHNLKFGIRIRRSLARALEGLAGADHVRAERNRLAGFPGRYRERSSQPFAGPRRQHEHSQPRKHFGELPMKTFDAYAQDDYKATSRLTLNYGVRWSLFVPMRERNNIYSAVDLNKPNPAAGNLPGTISSPGAMDRAPSLPR